MRQYGMELSSSEDEEDELIKRTDEAQNESCAVLHDRAARRSFAFTMLLPSLVVLLVLCILTAGGTIKWGAMVLLLTKGRRSSDATAPPSAPPSEPPPLLAPTPPSPRIVTEPPSLAKDALDGSMAAALRLVEARTRTRLVLLTFGNAGVRDHLQNFCAHAQRAGAPHVVGAVDSEVFRLLAARHTPVYETPLARESYALDGSNSHSSRSWKRFAAMRTGEVAKMVALGWDVLHTDTDVVWLRDPTPYLVWCAPTCACHMCNAQP